MPEFVNPFSGMVPRKMTKAELIRAIRLNLSAEQEAIHLYMAHADATDDLLAKKVLIDVANEERVHAGEFERLLKYLAPDEEAFLMQGAREVEEMAAGASPSEVGEEAGMVQFDGEPMEEQGEEAIEESLEEAAQEAVPIKTIGSLFD